MPEVNIIVEAYQGENRSSDGSQFSVSFNPPFELPSTAKNITVSLQAATVWWTVPNIGTTNNTIVVSGPSVLGPDQTYTVVIDTGLYDLSQLEAAIQISLENQGAAVNPEPLISLLADNATSRVIIRLNYPSSQVDLTGIGTFRDILGFPAVVLSRPPISNIAPNVAQFNTVNSFFIHTDLVREGIRQNSIYDQAVGQVPITVSPGSLINYAPFNPPKISEPGLTGTKRSVLSFRLTDELNRAVDTGGESWSARLSIHYE